MLSYKDLISFIISLLLITSVMLLNNHSFILPAYSATTCSNLPISAVTASGNDGNVPSNVLDNNLNTRWSNLGIGSWIRADLGSIQTICSVDIAWYSGNTRQNNFVIATSTDGTTFSNVLTTKSSGTTLNSEKYTIPSTNARYVRVTVNGNTVNAWASITELDIFISKSSSNSPPIANSKSVIVNKDTPTAITLTASDPDGNTLTYTKLTNPAHGTLTGTAPSLTYTPSTGYTGSDSFTFKVNDGTSDSNIATVSITVQDTSSGSCTSNLPISAVTASGNDGNVPSNVLDNNLNTRWSNLGIGSWIRADLGSIQTICSVDIAWYSGNTRQNNFVIATSTDGTTFSNVLTTKSSGTTLNSEKYTIPSTNARYVRVTVNGNTVNAWASITELDIFISKSSSNSPPIANSKSVIVNKDTPTAITLTASDPDGNTLTYTKLTNPAHGTLTGTAPSLTYTPSTGYTGSDSFTFKVNDGNVDSNIATISITISTAGTDKFGIKRAIRDEIRWGRMVYEYG